MDSPVVGSAPPPDHSGAAGAAAPRSSIGNKITSKSPHPSRSTCFTGPEVSTQIDLPTTEGQEPGPTEEDVGNKLPAFIIEVYALNRKGTRLHGSSQLAPGARPPPLFCLQGGGLLVSALSDERLGLDTDINVLDAEVEARLLSLGRPLPSQVALYGATSWGKKPLQVAVADGTLSDLAAVEKFANRYLRNSLVPHNDVEVPNSARDLCEKQTPRSKLPTAGAGAAESAATETVGNTGMSGEPPQNHKEPTMSDDPIDEEGAYLATISPQLTSLNVNGCAPTIRQLVANGYLHDLGRIYIDSIVRDASPEAMYKEENGVMRCPKIFAVEIMFDEIRTGLASSLPDIRASTPHGESASVFTITDDVPVDARVDLRNISRVDIDDAYFECDFDMTFSWLVKSPPQELITELTKIGELPPAMIDKVLVNSVDSELVAAKVADGAVRIAKNGETSQQTPSKTSRKIWRPQWSFSNRINPEVGSVVERLTLSERQVMARGMKLKQSVVDSYWTTENLSLEELENRAKLDEKNQDGVRVSPSSGASSNKLQRGFTQSKLSNAQSSNVMEMLTRRCSSGARSPSDNFATYDIISKAGIGSFNISCNTDDPAINDADGGVEDVSELVYVVKCRGVRFSVSFDHMEAFPFDALSLPVKLFFREPFGIYQAHIARIVKAGDEFESCPGEELKEYDNVDLEEKSHRLHKEEPSMRLREVNFKSASKAANKVHPELKRHVSSHISIESLQTVHYILESAAKAMSEIKEPSKVVWPNFQPALDLVPIPGRMRLRVSNDNGNHDGITDHRLRYQKWGIDELYIQKLSRLPQVFKS